jgi:hypothetical protein
MNENQPHNDHNLHIEPCSCGNQSPEISGDEYDADVTCEKCNKCTPSLLGTRAAIAAWNLKVKNKMKPVTHTLNPDCNGGEEISITSDVEVIGEQPCWNHQISLQSYGACASISFGNVSPDVLIEIGEKLKLIEEKEIKKLKI